MEPIEFRKLRDDLDQGGRDCVMIKENGEWSYIYLDTLDFPKNWKEGLDDVEYNEAKQDFHPNGNLIGFIYKGYNCPAALGYGRRSDEEKDIMKYIWKHEILCS